MAQEIYKITHPHGKIYVGMGPKVLLRFFGSPSAKATECIVADLDDSGMTSLCAKILWESKTAEDEEVRAA